MALEEASYAATVATSAAEAKIVLESIFEFVGLLLNE